MAKAASKKLASTGRRTFRTRNKIRRINIAQNSKREIRPRLSVHRTGKQIYAQIIDDLKGVTLAAASTLDKELKEKLKSGSNKDAAGEVGKLIAARAKKAGISKVVFDRGPFLYHGRVKALADAAREGGLE
ncbi:MAG: 50S ribosomal protein L18, partial [Alphaproteobacteria bacterium]|nr:50S ribosomal protein L18 [Alphaproteobacteria bacterium]